MINTGCSLTHGSGRVLPPAARPLACISAGALLLLTGCDSGSAGGGDGTVLRDSADLVIVENRVSRPAWGESGRRLGEPVLQIGAVDAAGPRQLHEVRHSAFLPGGEVAVIDGHTAEVRIFDADGRHLRTIGGQGEGPGEFRSPWRVYPAAAGDSLMVVDLYRAVSVFDAEGRYGRRFVPGDLEGESQGVPKGQFADGSLLFMKYVREDRPSSGIGRTRVDLVRIDPDGTQVGSFGRFDGQTARFGGGPQYIYGPEAWMVAGDSTFFYGPGDRFEVRRIGLDGETTRLVRLDLEPRAVTQEDRDAWMDMLIRSNPNTAPELLRELMGEPESPPFFPHHGRIVIDDRGSLWAQEFARPGSDEPDTWHVFDPDGAYLGPVTVPLGFHVHEVRGDRVLGRWTDELGVEFVRMYELEEDGA